MFHSLWRACAAGTVLCVGLLTAIVSAENHTYGRYGHDIVPFVPDSTGYVVIAPQGTGPWNVPRQKMRERPYDDGVYDSNGGWQIQWSYAPRYPYGWFGAGRNTTYSRSQNPHGRRTEWHVK
jgi:hypothetical protein